MSSPESVASLPFYLQLIGLSALDGWHSDPVIITPTLYKEKQLTELVFDKINSLWLKAKEALSHCKKLVVIGY